MGSDSMGNGVSGTPIDWHLRTLIVLWIHKGCGREHIMVTLPARAPSDRLSSRLRAVPLGSIPRVLPCTIDYIIALTHIEANTT
jgi:hypothetical protein